MTVRELIEELRKMPPGMEVVLPSDGEGNEFRRVGGASVWRMFDANDYGRLDIHRDPEPGPGEPYDKVFPLGTWEGSDGEAARCFILWPRG